MVKLDQFLITYAVYCPNFKIRSNNGSVIEQFTLAGFFVSIPPTQIIFFYIYTGRNLSGFLPGAEKYALS